MSKRKKQTARERLKEYKPLEYSLATKAEELFGDGKNPRPLRIYEDIAMFKGSPIPCLRILIDNKIQLFFCRRNKVWEFESWEIGDFTLHKEDWFPIEEGEQLGEWISNLNNK